MARHRKSGRAGRGRLRRIATVLVVLVVLLLVLTALAPTLLSGVVRGRVEEAAGSQLNGTLHIGSLGLSWFGQQRIDHIVLRGDDGSQVADLSLDVPVSLLSIVTGTRAIDGIRLTGDVWIARDADGRLNVQRLIREDTDRPGNGEDGGAPRSGEPAEPSTLTVPGKWSASVDLSGVTVTYEDAALAESVVMAVDQADIAYAPGRPITADLAMSLTGATSGGLTFHAKVTDLVDASGVVDSAKAKAELEIVGTGLPVSLADALMGRDGLLIAAVGPTAAFELRAHGDLLNGQADLVMTGDRASVRGALLLDDGVMRLADDVEPLRLTAELSDALLQEFAPQAGMSLVGDPAQVRIELAGLSLPIGTSAGLSGASVALRIDSDPLDLQTKSPDIPQLHITGASCDVSTSDLTDAITITASLTADPGGGQAGTFTMDLVIRDIIASDGALTPHRSSLEGTVRATQLPTSVMQPFVAALGVDPVRDIGPTLDLSLTAEASGLGDETRTDLMLEIDSQHITGLLDMVATAGRLTAGAAGATLSANISPQIAANMLGEGSPVTLRDIGRVGVEVESFDLPLDWSAIDVAEMAFAGRLSLDRAAVLLDQHDDPIELADVSVTFESAAGSNELAGQVTGQLAYGGDVAHIDGAGTLVGPTPGAPQGVAGLIALQPAATITLRGVPTSLALPYVGEHAALVHDGLGDALDLTATLSPNEDQVGLTLDVSNAQIALDARASLHPNRVDIIAAKLNATVQPELIEHVLASADPSEATDDAAESDRAEPIALDGPVPIVVSLGPLHLPIIKDGRFWLEGAVLSVKLNVPEDVVLTGVAGTVEPVILRRMFAGVEIPLSSEADAVTLRGVVLVRRQVEDVLVARITWEGTSDIQAGRTDLLASIKGLNVQNVEALLGRERGSLVELVGPTGGIDLRLASTQAEQVLDLVLDLKRLHGRVTGSIADGVFALREPATLQVIASPKTMTSLLADLLVDPEKKAPAPLTFNRAADAVLHVETLQCDLGNVLDPASLQLAATADVSLLQGRTVDDVAFAYRNIVAQVRTGPTESAALHVDVTGFSHTQPADAVEPALDVHLTANDWVSAAGEPAAAQAKLTGTIRIDNASTGLVDALTGFRGVLAAALGRNTTLHAQLDGFSRSSGTIDMVLTSPNGHMRLAGSAKDNVLMFSEPLTAELIVTEALSDMILTDLLPIVQLEKRPQDGPIRITATDLRAPLDGDLSKLNGTIDIDVGQARYIVAEPLASILAATGNEAQASTRDLLPPIHISLTDGVARYAELPVVINRTRMLFTGRVNLVTRRIRLDTEIPLSELDKGLFRSFGGLGDLSKVLPPDTMIPIVVRGTIDKPELDLERGLKKLQENLGKGLLEGGLEEGLKQLFGD
ncbi:MAG: hypothetical protein KAS72_13435 [Phycisphaerales bacterium]|nr:hypothetical protein [Phycisphaerales bacterium]